MTILKLLPSGAFIPMKPDTEVGWQIGFTWYFAVEQNIHVVLGEVLPLLSLPDKDGEVPTFVVVETKIFADINLSDELAEFLDKPVWVISWHTDKFDKTEDVV